MHEGYSIGHNVCGNGRIGRTYGLGWKLQGRLQSRRGRRLWQIKTPEFGLRRLGTLEEEMLFPFNSNCVGSEDGSAVMVAEEANRDQGS